MTWIRLGLHLISLEAIAEIDMSKRNGMKAVIHFIGGGSCPVDDKYIGTLLEQIGQAHMIPDVPGATPTSQEADDLPPGNTAPH